MRALSLILLLTTAAFAGLKHDFDRPVFIYAHHPDPPIAAYAKGALGIPSPEHARIYLYAAYRYLNNVPFTAAEQKAYLFVWEQRSTRLSDAAADSQPDDRWTAIRKTVPLPVPAKISQMAPIAIRAYAYENLCAEDAFDSAADTLRLRIAKFGANSAAVKFWTEGQDRVFAACNGEADHLPDPAPADLPPLIRADRDYQIAAALLYFQRLDEALTRFRAIAQDRNSPWHVWAPYLIGRTLLWQARLTQSEPEYYRNLRIAEAQFRAVLSDRSLASTHAAAERLLDRCLLVTSTRAGLERIARRLASPQFASARESDLLMYLNAIDALEEPVVNAKGLWDSRKNVPWPLDDLSLWWQTFQSTDPGAYARALTQWQTQSANAWLYCALSKAGENSPHADELLTAARAFPWDHPAGPAMHYQTARLLALKGSIEEARAEMAKVVDSLGRLPSAHNRALDLQAQLAPTMEEFASLVPRRVILASTEMDADEWDSQTKIRHWWPDSTSRTERDRYRAGLTKAERAAADLASRPRLDWAGARVLSEKLPLDTMRAIALDPNLLPANLRNELQLVVWTRAVLLGRFDVASEFAPIMADAYPAVAVQLRSVTNDASAARVLLELPGARPYMSVGYGRLAPPETHDEWGRNWWYRFTPAEMYGIDLPYVGDVGSFGRLRPPHPLLLPQMPFLSEAQQKQAASEFQRLSQDSARGFNWIATRIVKDIQDHPSRSDARTLYLIVSAANVNWWAQQPDAQLPRPGLKAAYRLLSTRYASSDYFRRAKELAFIQLDQLK